MTAASTHDLLLRRFGLERARLSDTLRSGQPSVYISRRRGRTLTIEQVATGAEFARTWPVAQLQAARGLATAAVVTIARKLQPVTSTIRLRLPARLVEHRAGPAAPARTLRSSAVEDWQHISINEVRNTAVAITADQVLKIYVGAGESDRARSNACVEIQSQLSDELRGTDITIPEVSSHRVYDDRIEISMSRVVVADRTISLEQGLEVTTQLATAFATVAPRVGSAPLSIAAAHHSMRTGATLAPAVESLLAERFDSTVDRCAAQYDALSHGDLWLGNLLPTSPGVAVIDWDNVAMLPAHYDAFYMAMFHLAVSSGTIFRRHRGPVDPGQLARHMATSEQTSGFSRDVGAFQSYVRRTDMTTADLAVAEACYFRLRAVYWACDPDWSGAEPTLTGWADHVDALETGREPGIMARLLESSPAEVTTSRDSTHGV